VPCYAAAVHDGAARCLVIDFKYRGNRAIGRAIGEKIAALFDPPAADAVAAVPLHKGSERPYNQSDIIARYAARCWGLPHIPEALCWTKATGPQMGRNSIMRKSLPNGAIAAKKPLAGLKVVLVDDVYTTGATMRAAIEGAESAGCRVAAAYVWTKRVSRSENPLSWQGAEVSL
jgi:predicted amidophosphoribosyltransferase